MSITRRGFVGGGGMALAAGRAQAAKRTPNFVFLLADDHAGYVMGCDGNAQAVTPNLDRLAREGTRFGAHYCNSPVCTPSRQSFFTGQLPHSAGVTVLKTPLDAGKPTIAKQLKRAGYATAVFGKMHFNRAAEAGLHGFDVMRTEGEINKAWAQAGGKPPPAGTSVKKLPWKPFQTPAREWLNADNLPYPREEEGMRSAFLVREVSEYLDQNQARPFALWVSFQEPHSPFDFPTGWAKKRAADFPVPRVGPEDGWQIPNCFRDLQDREKQGIVAAYYNSAAYLDHNLGRVLQMLKRRGLDENTLVVYMADHGYSLGQHGRFEKHCGYDPALRVPLIMRWPGRIREGHVIRDLTESVDVPHTILDLLNAPELPLRHGSSLRPYVEGRRPSKPRDHIFSEYLENEEAFIRTAAHKYVYCTGRRARTDGYITDTPTPGRYERLYDLNTDPGEFTDVAAKHPDIVRDLRAKLLARFRETHPEGAAEPSGAAEQALDWYLRPRDA